MLLSPLERVAFLTQNRIKKHTQVTIHGQLKLQISWTVYEPWLERDTRMGEARYRNGFHVENSDMIVIERRT